MKKYILITSLIFLTFIIGCKSSIDKVNLSWKYITVYDEKIYAISNNGTIWSFDQNYTNFIKISDDKNWKEVAINHLVFGLKENGKLYTINLSNKEIQEYTPNYLWTSIEAVKGSILYGINKEKSNLLGIFFNHIEEKGDEILKIETLGDVSDWKQISASAGNHFGLRNDGSIWGHNWEYLSSIGRQIGEDFDWKQIGAKTYNNHYAIKEDGTLWKFDENYRFGEDNGKKERIGHDSDWAMVDTNQKYCFGIKENGTLWRIDHNLSQIIELQNK